MKVPIRISASLLFLLLYSPILFSQTDVDRSQICQECLNVFELKDHIIGDQPGTELPVYMFSGDVNLLGTTGLSSFGRRVEILSADPADRAGMDTYFRFHKLEVLGNSATVEFSLFFRDEVNEATYSTLHVFAKMQKTPNGWSVQEKSLDEK